MRIPLYHVNGTLRTNQSLEHPAPVILEQAPCWPDLGLPEKRDHSLKHRFRLVEKPENNLSVLEKHPLLADPDICWR